MRGQWVGKFEGTTSGDIILNVEELENSYLVVAHLLAYDNKIPSVAASFRTPNKNSPFQMRTDQLYAFDPTSRLPEPWNKVKQHFPNMAFSSYADVKGTWDKQSLTVDWTTDLGAAGHAVLQRSRADEPSDIEAKQMTWSEFRNHIETLKARALIFRGQCKPWRLRTKFHRSGRTNLYRYRSEDIPQLHRHLSARTRHLFDLTKPDEFGSFCSMVQHHGYPTPMLDWSRSPYVAAFFAYRTVTAEVVSKAGPADKVRIHVFEHDLWKTAFPQYPDMLYPGLHMSVIEFVAVENERLVPQQGVSTVTNVDDVETYIQSCERSSKAVYLTAYDLPIKERSKAMSELSYMGITAGSLFPGLDGACEELRERNFDL
jgi:FRG domain